MNPSAYRFRPGAPSAGHVPRAAAAWHRLRGAILRRWPDPPAPSMASARRAVLCAPVRRLRVLPKSFPTISASTCPLAERARPSVRLTLVVLDAKVSLTLEKRCWGVVRQ